MDQKSIVLIVDDSSVNRELLKAVFDSSESCYDIVEADSGMSAFQKIESQIPDIILLDIQMPEMDGFEVCQKLKEDEKTRDIPVLFITALGDTNDKVKGFEIGASDYITKPINPDEVKARVNAHLKSREAEKSRMEAENLKTVKDMIATYNHNMNQPLMTVYTYMATLMLKFDEEDKTHQTLTKIKGELDKVNEILKKIQSISEVKKTDYVGDSGMLEL